MFNLKCSYFWLVFTFLLFVSFSASGQRQTAGRWSVEGYGNVGGDGIYTGILGGGVRVSPYGFNGHVHYGVDLVTSPRTYTVAPLYDDDDPSIVIYPGEKYIMSSLDVSATVGYLYRLLATRSRWLILSGGATFGIGLSHCDALKDVYFPDADNNLKVNGLVLYGAPELELEMFPFKSVSFYLAARPRMTMLNTLKGNAPWFKFRAAFGMKVYL